MINDVNCQPHWQTTAWQHPIQPFVHQQSAANQQIAKLTNQLNTVLNLQVSSTRRQELKDLKPLTHRVAYTVKKAFPTADESSSEMLLCYYFRIGINNTQLSTAMTLLQNLSFEETVAHTIRMNTELNAIRRVPIHSSTRRNEIQRSTYRQDFTARRPAQQTQAEIFRPPPSAGFPANAARNKGYTEEQRSGQQGQVFSRLNPPRFTEMRTSNINARANQVQHEKGKNKENPKEKRNSESGGYVFTLQLEINGLTVRGFLDTGASIFILLQGCYTTVAGEDRTLVKVTDRRPCIASNGQPLKVIGEVVLPVEYKQTQLSAIRFTVAADTFGHDMIVGTDLLDLLAFEFLDRHSGSHHSLQSLHEVKRPGKNPTTPVRVLRTTRVQPKESKVLTVHFDREKDALYMMEPNHIDGDVARVESALVGNDPGPILWFIQNTGTMIIHLESDTVLGYAFEVDHVFDDRDVLPKEEDAYNKVFTCFSRDDDGDLLFTLHLQEAIEHSNEHRLEELMGHIRKN